MANPNSNFDQVMSVTAAKYSKTMASSVIDNIPLFYFLKKNGGIKEIDGGVKLYENLRIAENGNFKWFNGYEELSLTPTADFTVAEYEWKECNANVVASGLEIAQNSGESKRFDLIDGKLESTEETILNNLGAAAFYANTENDGKSLGGLQHLVADLPTSGTVGGINRANYAFFRNQYLDCSDLGITPSATAIYEMLDRLYRRCSINNDAPGLVILGETYHQYLESATRAMQRFVDESEPDGGVPYIRYKKAKVIYDGHCADERGYMLNLKFIKLHVHQDVNMQAGKVKHPTNQNASIIPINWMGNLVCSNPAKQGVMHA